MVAEWHDFTDEAERRPVRSRDGIYEVSLGHRSLSVTLGSRSRSGTVGSKALSEKSHQLTHGETV